MGDVTPTYGGQALIEGVLIRGARASAIALRTPDGSIVTTSEPVEQGIAAAMRGVPVLRGIATLYETFVFGTKALFYSARVADGRPNEPLRRSEAFISAATIAAAVAIFIAAPLGAARAADAFTGSALLGALTEGNARLAMILGYIALVAQVPSVKRVFEYHAAEHRTIHAYERGSPLTAESVRTFANAHPRCGTAFLLTVGVLSFAAFMALGSAPISVQILQRLILLPAIASVAYEIIRASQTYEDHWLARIVQTPNLWLQRLTTRDPDDSQIEVAIAALEATVQAESRLASSDLVLANVAIADDDVRDGLR